MKKLFLLICCYLITFLCGATCTFAQAPEWLKVLSAGGSYVDRVNQITTDHAGNFYIAGYFLSDTITFGSATLINNPTVPGSADMFFVKYNPDGEVAWAQTLGGENGEEITGITTDKSGNIYITGIFNSPTLSFEILPLINDTLIDSFVAKFDTDGNCLWSRAISGNRDEVSNSITTDEGGNVYLTGHYSGSTVNFGTISITKPGYFADMFVAKYDSEGNTLWVQTASGHSFDEGKSITTDKNNNVYITGFFESSTLNFGEIKLRNTGRADMFIVKYDSSGRAIWAKSPGGKSRDYGYSITTDKSGNIYTTGAFSSDSLTFDKCILQNNPAVTYDDDIFITKHDPDGNLLWAQSAGGLESDIGGSITTDESGNMYLAGYFRQFPIAFGSVSLNNNGFEDMFVVKYNSEGNALWGKSMGGNNTEHVRSITAGADGKIYITGEFESPSVTFGKSTLTNIGFNDIFIATIDGTTTSVLEKNDLPFIPVSSTSGLNQFYISNLPPGIWDFSMFTIEGKFIYKTTVTDSYISVDLSRLTKGTYVYQLYKDDIIVKTGKILHE